MSFDPHAPDSACHELQHDVNTTLTIIAGRAELLQRQLRRRNGFSAEQRQWLDAGLTDILDATRVVANKVRHLPQDGNC
jgi:K+-sensing histidine kinase KdpD